MSSSIADPVVALAPRRLGVAGLVAVAVASSAPLIVLAGGATTIFAVTGNPAYPLALLLVVALLAVFTSGYAAMSREVVTAGGFFGYVARGLGGTAAAGAGAVAAVAYNSIQISLYGLLGSVLGDMVGLPWWVLPLVVLAAVAVLGVLRVDISAAIIGVLLVCEVAAVLIYDAAALSSPASPGLALDAFSPAELFSPTAGAVIAFAIAAFIGFEQAALYSEEVVNPRRSVARATIIALTLTGSLYAISAWAMTVNVGPESVGAAAAEAGPGLVFGVLAGVWGPLADIASVLLITSIVAGLIGLHHAATRYHHALGREGVLPSALGSVGSSGAPWGGSVAQTALAAAVVLGFAVIGGNDPSVPLALFAWLSGLAAVAMVTLLVLTAVAILTWGYDGRAGMWSGRISPALAAGGLFVVLAVVIVNFGSLIGDPSSSLAWVLPLIVPVVYLAGLARGQWLRSNRPEVHARIGGGER